MEPVIILQDSDDTSDWYEKLSQELLNISQLPVKNVTISVPPTNSKQEWIQLAIDVGINSDSIVVSNFHVATGLMIYVENIESLFIIDDGKQKAPRGYRVPAQFDYEIFYYGSNDHASALHEVNRNISHEFLVSVSNEDFYVKVAQQIRLAYRTRGRKPVVNAEPLINGDLMYSRGPFKMASKITNTYSSIDDTPKFRKGDQEEVSGEYRTPQTTPLLSSLIGPSPGPRNTFATNIFGQTPMYKPKLTTSGLRWGEEREPLFKNDNSLSWIRDLQGIRGEELAKLIVGSLLVNFEDFHKTDQFGVYEIVNIFLNDVDARRKVQELSDAVGGYRVEILESRYGYMKVRFVSASEAPRSGTRQQKPRNYTYYHRTNLSGRSLIGPNQK